MTRIGFLSKWGDDRGLSMLTLNYCKMLNGQHELFILKQGNNQISDNYKTVDVSITESKEYTVEPQAFVRWLSTNKITACFFNEFGQWQIQPDNLVKIAKDLGVKTYAAELVVERFTPDQAAEYDRILAPTLSYIKFMRANKIRNFTYAPYSIDLKEFNKTKCCYIFI